MSDKDVDLGPCLTYQNKVYKTFRIRKGISFFCLFICIVLGNCVYSRHDKERKEINNGISTACAVLHRLRQERRPVIFRLCQDRSATGNRKNLEDCLRLTLHLVQIVFQTGE